MENWKVITEFGNGRYEVSNFGRVRSNYGRACTIMRYSLNPQGKPQVNFSINSNKNITRTIESLVCRYHLNYIVPRKNVPADQRIIYRNGNREDVRIENLILPIVNRKIA